MAHKAPGKSHHKGVSLQELFRMFPDDATAERWFAEKRWPDGPHCPYCGSTNIQSGAKHLDRYVTEFSVRRNARAADTAEQMVEMARGMVGKRLTYRNFVTG